MAIHESLLCTGTEARRSFAGYTEYGQEVEFSHVDVRKQDVSAKQEALTFAA